MEARTILLIEDNPDDVELTQRAIRKNNILNKLVVAKDGVEALDYLFGTGMYAARDMSEKPAAILLDLKLPRVGGLEVLRRMRTDERTKLVPVIVLTSSTEERDLIESYRLECNSYIRKPIDFMQFSEAVRQFLMYWLLLNRAPPA